jgi:DNA polymerase-3 subunit epsilon
MTRGQESLIMDLEEAAPSADEAAAGLAERPALKIVRAADDELAEHAKVLADIDKASQGKCVWLAADNPAASNDGY